MKKWIFFDTFGKIVGLILSATIFSASHASFRSFDTGSSCDSKAIEEGLGLV